VVSSLAEEEQRLNELLSGKVVARVFRHRDREIVIEFDDGTRFFADASEIKNRLELSVTVGHEDG